MEIAKNETNINKESEKFTIAENHKYYAETTGKLKEINNMIQKLIDESKNLNDNEKRANLDNITAKIKLYREQFYNVMEFLPNYDKLQYAKNYEEELNKVNKLKNTLFPKKKFSFSSKIKGKKKEENNTSPNNNDNNILPSNNEENKIDNETDLIIKDKKDEKIKIREEDILNKNNIIIENIFNCQIYILFNFKACYIKNIKNSQIFIGSVSGGSHITSSHNCQIYIITHQLRIHETFNSQFYVLINSNPIIENSKDNIFYPLKIKYFNFNDNVRKARIDIDNNKWNLIQDFQWLKKEKSPNFDVMDNNEEVFLE